MHFLGDILHDTSIYIYIYIYVVLYFVDESQPYQKMQAHVHLRYQLSYFLDPIHKCGILTGRLGLMGRSKCCAALDHFDLREASFSGTFSHAFWDRHRVPDVPALVLERSIQKKNSKLSRKSMNIFDVTIQNTWAKRGEESHVTNGHILEVEFLGRGDKMYRLFWCPQLETFEFLGSMFPAIQTPAAEPLCPIFNVHWRLFDSKSTRLITTFDP